KSKRPYKKNAIQTEPTLISRPNNCRLNAVPCRSVMCNAIETGDDNNCISTQGVSQRTIRPASTQEFPKTRGKNVGAKIPTARIGPAATFPNPSIVVAVNWPSRPERY